MADLMKNATPGLIARMVSLLVALFVFILLVLVKTLLVPGLTWLFVFLVPALTLIFSYFLIYYVLDKFLYRKIKLIYKTIYDAKIPEREKSKSVKMESDVIADAENEVIEWTKKKAKEDQRQKKTRNIPERVSRECVP